MKELEEDTFQKQETMVESKQEIYPMETKKEPPLIGPKSEVLKDMEEMEEDRGGRKIHHGSSFL